MATSHFNLSTKLNAIFNLTNALLAAVLIMEYEEIVSKVKSREINCEQAFESLAEIGK